jgi:hypothetical protein
VEKQIAGILGGSEEDLAMTKEELAIVVKWLENRYQDIQKEKLVIEGDNFAHSKGKWPQFEEYSREATALKISLNTARDQYNEAH